MSAAEKPSAPRERPCLMNAPMVRATLAGTKTQTRRLVKAQQFPAPFHERALDVGVDVALREMYLEGRWGERPFPHGAPGDRLWVRETWGQADSSYDEWDFLRGKPRPHLPVIYRATWGDDDEETFWRPSIHMPRWASRITLEITGIRVERLQDITEEDAMAEGAVFVDHGLDQWRQQRPGWSMDPAEAARGWEYCLGTARTAFGNLWVSVYGPKSWQQNPWVWVVSFKRVER